MRLLRLALDAYGPFTGVALDLSAGGKHGLHLIYGPNEAGKSSALGAIIDLLFGIPEKTTAAHLHPGSALRLAALVERDGQELGFVRRKKRKDSLFTPGDEHLEEARLARYLNGLDRGSYQRLFGLDQQRLKEGAEEMLSGKGDVGEALFDAGASGRSVHQVKLSLAAEAEELFKDRGQNPKLNRLLSLYAEQKKRAKDSQHSPEKYEEQQAGVRDKRREAEQRRAELAKLRARKEHATRLRSVLSSVVDRDRHSAQRTALGEVPHLRRNIGAERERLGALLAEAERDLRRLAQKRAEGEGRRAGLPEPSPLLAMPEEAVRAVERLMGGAQKSLDDLPKRQGEARNVRDAMESKLPRLGLGSDLEQVLARSLPVAEQARLSALAREFQGLSLKLENAERELPDAQAKVEAQTAILKHARSMRRIARDELVPSELVERFDGELGQAEEELEKIAERLIEGERQRAEIRQKLELLKGREGVPSAALLAEARAQREARLREAQELAADPKRKALELCLPLAALAQASTYADGLADRLRSEAQRVADAEALEQQLAKSDRDRERLREGEASAEAKLAQVNVRWQRVAEGLGHPELLPREAQRLLQDEREAWREIARFEQELSRAHAALAAVEVRRADASRALANWRSEWDKAVRPLGLPESSRPEQALALLAELAELTAQRKELSEIERRITGIQRDIALFADKVQKLTAGFAPELSSLGPIQAAQRLLEQYRAASDVARERAALDAELLRNKREQAETEARLSEQRAGLAELCREAGVTQVSELIELEQRVERARVLDAEIERLDTRLAEICEGEDVSALIDEARQSERGAISASIEELEDLIAARDEETRDLEREVTKLELGLRIYEGRDGADAAQALSATAASLAELSSAWARRRVAAAVLERVVEQYRERNQGPVLSRASELFARLTLGRFSRLQVGLEDTRLECVEADGARRLELEQLSEGTRSQLFMALKLASLEQYVKTAPPLPLVLDDVLVEWDDERARVALEVLAGVSESLQILLFTHHGRDLQAARALGDPRIFVHQLPGAPRGPSPALATEALR
jgi:uncharacterized protein YhaN